MTFSKNDYKVSLKYFCVCPRFIRFKADILSHVIVLRSCVTVKLAYVISNESSRFFPKTQICYFDNHFFPIAFLDYTRSWGWWKMLDIYVQFQLFVQNETRKWHFPLSFRTRAHLELLLKGTVFLILQNGDFQTP